MKTTKQVLNGQCTSMTITSKEGNLYWSRTLDNEEDNHTVMTTVPSNFPIKAQTGNWRSKYAFMGSAINGTYFFFDGMNEVGLTGDVQMLEECTWGKRQDLIQAGKTPVLGEEFVAWILSQCQTVDEVEQLTKSAGLVDEKFMFVSQYPSHYTFTDRDHRSIILEPVDNGLFKIYKDTMGIMTNSPEYPWHVTNLRNYMELQDHNRDQPRTIRGETIKQIESGSGLQGLPGDYTSPSRFIRAAYLSDFGDQPSDDEAVLRLYNLNKTVMITPGWEKSDDKGASDHNIYWVCYDQANLTAYMQPSVTNTITKVILNTKATEKETHTINYDPYFYEA